MRYIGAHMSVAGGFYKAIERVIMVGGNALQIFCKNQRQWKAPPLTTEEINKFSSVWQENGLIPIAVHAGYLINLASPDNSLTIKSIKAFTEELERTAQLGIHLIILHPGAHRGQGAKKRHKKICKKSG